MNEATALESVFYAVDDALSEQDVREIPKGAWLIGWQAGFEAVFVAVWSCLPGVELGQEDAEEIASDIMIENRWFDRGEMGPDYALRKTT